MKLENLIEFDHHVTPSIPEEYRPRYKYVYLVDNEAFMLIEECHRHPEFPALEELMATAKLGNDDYLLFGKSDGFDWSDRGCNYYYAIATSRKIPSMRILVDLMWRDWQLKNCMDGFIITNRGYCYGLLGRVEETCDREKALFHGYLGGCACQHLLVLEKLGNTYRCILKGSEGVLTKEQLVEQIQRGFVYNAKLKQTAAGNLSITVKSIDRKLSAEDGLCDFDKVPNSIADMLEPKKSLTDIVDF